MNKKTIEKCVTSVLLGLSVSSSVMAHDDLGETTVLATGFEKSTHDLAYASTMLHTDELMLERVPSIEEVLGMVPGVISLSTGGQRGSISSVFIRGLRTADTQLRVDGVRVSNANFGLSSNGLLGVLNSTDFGTLEVLRGAQSARYGSDAMSGVIGIDLEAGMEGVGSRAFVEAGSFGSFRTDFNTQGVMGKLAYSVGMGYETTQNDIEHNDFYQNSSRLRLDYGVNDDWTLGFTFRHGDSYYEAPNYGGTFANGLLVDHFDYLLTTVFVDGYITDSWQSKLTLGYYEADYDDETEMNGNFWTDSKQFSIEWNNNLELNDHHIVSFGAAYEDVDYVDAFSVRHDRQVKSVHVNSDYEITQDLSATVGARWEDYSDYDGELTYRGGVSYKLSKMSLVRASVGTAYRIPSFGQLYGFFGNPNLQPQESFSWDIGYQREVVGGEFSITYFESDVENAITLTGSTNTPGKTKANGIEFGFAGDAMDNRLRYAVNYTWLDNSLDDLPEHSARAELSYSFDEKWTVGGSASYMDNRSIGNENLEQFLIFGAFVQYKATSDVTIHARAENFTDEDYVLLDNQYEGTFPGRGAGFFAGVTVNF